MPEFILDHGDAVSAKRFAALDSFTQGYIEAMFFTSTGTGDDGDLEDASFAELAPSALASILEDCADFQKSFCEDLDEISDTYHVDYSQHGHDFWLTRNRHGAGFWDRGYGELGDRMTKMAYTYGSRDLYRGDDGSIYLQ